MEDGERESEREWEFSFSSKLFPGGEDTFDTSVLLLYDSVYSVGNKVRFGVNTPQRLFVSSAVKYQSWDVCKRPFWPVSPSVLRDPITTGQLRVSACDQISLPRSICKLTSQGQTDTNAGGTSCRIKKNHKCEMLSERKFNYFNKVSVKSTTHKIKRFFKGVWWQMQINVLLLMLNLHEGRKYSQSFSSFNKSQNWMIC